MTGVLCIVLKAESTARTTRDCPGHLLQQQRLRIMWLHCKRSAMFFPCRTGVGSGAVCEPFKKHRVGFVHLRQKKTYRHCDIYAVGTLCNREALLSEVSFYYLAKLFSADKMNSVQNLAALSARKSSCFS